MLSQAGRTAGTEQESSFQCLLHSLGLLWTNHKTAQQGPWQATAWIGTDSLYSPRHWGRTPETGQHSLLSSKVLCSGSHFWVFICQDVETCFLWGVFLFVCFSFSKGKIKWNSYRRPHIALKGCLAEGQ